MEEVFKFLTEKINLTQDDSVVVGVSGGGDSMCLLHILMQLKAAIGFKIIVAHINHKIRIESDMEEEFLKEYAANNDLIFESMKIKSYPKDNFHKIAREKRYQFYEELLNKYHSCFLMTAHHGDDLMETILMRLTRGSTLAGYSGIPLIDNRSNYKLIRPLLFVTKEMIIKYNEENKISYCTDISNFSSKYTRNRFRQQILPFLKEENPQVHLKFLKFNQLLSDVYKYIEKEVEVAYNSVYENQKLNIVVFLEKEELIQRLILEKIFKDLSLDLAEIQDIHIELLLDLITSQKTGRSLNLPDGYIARIDYHFLKFEQSKYVNKSYVYRLEDGLILPNGMRFQIITREENGNDTLHLSSEDIKLPLYVRNKQKGDYIELKGIKGRRKVSDIFIDEKISRSERNSYPVVLDSEGKIVWIPKLKKSKYDGKNNKKCDIIYKCL